MLLGIRVAALAACVALATACTLRDTTRFSGTVLVVTQARPQASPGADVLPTATVGLAEGHGCAVGSDHRVYCWGDNGQGELGDGTQISRPAPVRVLGVRDAIGVAVARDYNCALLRGGSVSCWGSKPWGNFRSSTDAEVAPGGYSFVHIAAGTDYLCGIDAQKMVRCVGEHGLLTRIDALGARSAHETWELIADTENVIQVLPLEHGGCFLHADATASCWEKSKVSEKIGRLPQQVPSLTEAVRLEHSGRGLPCAVLRDGSGVCWSDALMRPGDFYEREPVVFPAVDRSKTLEFTHAKGVSCMRMVDGTVHCAGDNSYGAVGSGRPSYSCAPAALPHFEVVSLTHMDERRVCGIDGTKETVCVAFRDIEADQTDAPSHGLAGGPSCHVKGKDVVCTGPNPRGELGGPPADGIVTIVHEKLGDITKIASADTQSCALLRSGELRCWGLTKNLPFDTKSEQTWTSPLALREMPLLKDLGVGSTGMCGLDLRGKMHCEGGRFSNLISANAQRGVRSLVTRGDAGCFVTDEGGVLCWGSGPLRPNPKDEPYSQQKLPRELDLENVTRLVAGRAHACSLNQSGQVYCWGDGRRGQVGAGSPAPNREPSLVLEGVRDVVAGGDASCALKTDGATVCWGGSMPGSAPQRYSEPVTVAVP